MKICVAYVVVTLGRITNDFISRFADTHHRFPPGVPHDTLVICNGGPLKSDQALLLHELKPLFWPRPNDDGWDVSGYQYAAIGPCKDYDMMVCLGESNYFHRAGWLTRLVYAWQKYGPGMYGPYATNVIRAHLQTTAFCCPPSLLAKYPVKVTNQRERYDFEHGPKSLWRRASAEGVPVRLVTWDGEWLPQDWRTPKNILWRGDQSNLLMWSNHSDAFRDADAERKANWSKSADRDYA